MHRAAALVALAAVSVLSLQQGAHALQPRRPETHRDHGKTSACMLGRLAPELYLLGSPSGGLRGPDSFLEALASSDAVARHSSSEAEETWRAGAPWTTAPNEFSLLRLEGWLEHYPTCTEDERKVAVDATTGYFACKAAPVNINSYYGIAGLKWKLVFMVFLRDPVARSYSHYHRFLANGVKEGQVHGCPARAFPDNFAQAAEMLLRTGSMCGDCSCNDVFTDSMYAESFRNWFEHFKPSQFHVVPFGAAVTPELLVYTWDLLQMPHGTGSMKKHTAGDEGSPTSQTHLSLEEDLSPTLMTLLSTYMEWRTGPKVVAGELVDTPANLYGFKGDRSSTDAIACWLRDGWGS